MNSAETKYPSIGPLFKVITDVKCYFLYMIATLFTILLYATGIGLLGATFKYLDTDIIRAISAILFLVIIVLVPFYAYSVLGIYILKKHCRNNIISMKEAIIRAFTTLHRFILPVVIIFGCITVVYFVSGTVVTNILPAELVTTSDFILSTIVTSIVYVLSVIIAPLFVVAVFAVVAGFIWDGYSVKQLLSATVKSFKVNTCHILLATVKVLFIIYAVIIVAGCIVFLLMMIIKLLFISSGDFNSFILLGYFNSFITIGLILSVLFAPLFASLMVRLAIYIYEIARFGVKLN